MSESQHGFLCLAVESHSMWLGDSRQYYRITDEYVELLRGETLDGAFMMARGTSYELEEKPPDWSQWRQLLASAEPLDQRRGLAAFASWDNLDAITSAQDIDDETRTRLNELSASVDPWIREQAIAAVKYLNERR
jgi:hypothetical protein